MGYFRNVECPKCHAGHGLGIYDDNGSYNGKCHQCSALFWNINIDAPEFQEQMQSVQSSEQSFQETIDQILTYPYANIPERGWNYPESKEYGVRVGMDASGVPKYLYYPYFRQGKLSFYKRREIATKTFLIIGNTQDCGFFGSQLYQGGGKLIIIVEGEDDVGAASRIFRDCNKNYRVISLINGAGIDKEGKGVVDKATIKNLSFLQEFQTVMLALDQDIPGQAMSVALAELICGETEVKFMTFSEKDARDMYRNNLHKDFLNAFFHAHKFVPNNLIRGEDITDEELRKPLAAGWPLPFPKIQKLLHGLRHGDTGGEITILAGGTGLGKTTCLREIEYFIKKTQHINIGHIYLEEPHIKTAQALIAMDNNVPIAAYRENPQIVSDEDYRRSKEELINGSIFHKHYGSLASEKLIHEMNYMFNREKCELIILDHVSMLTSGMESSREGERKDIDLLMTRLANFVTITGAHVIAACHLKRKSVSMKKDEYGKLDPDMAPYNRGGRVGPDALRGSASLEQLVHNIIALEGDNSGDEGTDPNLRWMRVCKNREWGELGLADYLRYSPQTGRIQTT